MKKSVLILLSSCLMLMLMSLTVTSCNSDGDETIALEYGNPRKMIVGEWIVGTGTRVWVFTDDGYYTDSQDGGKARHTWRLESNASDDTPYYSGIYLDGTLYDILLLSDGLWRLKSGNTIYELTREGSSSDGDGGSGKGSSSSSKINVQQLIGKWICYNQQWTEGSETWQKSYTSDDYYIELHSDYTGELSSGSDELMEIGRYHTFTWHLNGDKIVANVYLEPDEWKVVSLTDSQMTLYWQDEDYSIVCKFNKSK